MITEKFLNIKTDSTRKNLISKLELLKFSIDQELEQLSKSDTYYPNPLGIVQGQGQMIDVLCARLGTLNEIND
mgnify:CR=1 FL=1